MSKVFEDFIERVGKLENHVVVSGLRVRIDHPEDYQRWGIETYYNEVVKRGLLTEEQAAAVARWRLGI